eukprot:1143305-Pelagomonas_calceolata.AAC.3
MASMSACPQQEQGQQTITEIGATGAAEGGAGAPQANASHAGKAALPIFTALDHAVQQCRPLGT